MTEWYTKEEARGVLVSMVQKVSDHEEALAAVKAHCDEVAAEITEDKTLSATEIKRILKG